MRVVGYYSELPGFIDSVYPGRGTRDDVNGGTRTGGRIAFRFEPSDTSSSRRASSTRSSRPTAIRASTRTTFSAIPTRPPATGGSGERGQVTQFREGITDEFMLADLKLEFAFGSVGLTSATSYIDRTVEVLRDASQLTGSVTK